METSHTTNSQSTRTRSVRTSQSQSDYFIHDFGPLQFHLEVENPEKSHDNARSNGQNLMEPDHTSTHQANLSSREIIDQIDTNSCTTNREFRGISSANPANVSEAFMETSHTTNSQSTRTRSVRTSQSQSDYFIHDFDRLQFCLEVENPEKSHDNARSNGQNLMEPDHTSTHQANLSSREIIDQIDTNSCTTNREFRGISSANPANVSEAFTQLKAAVLAELTKRALKDQIAKEILKKRAELLKSLKCSKRAKQIDSMEKEERIDMMRKAIAVVELFSDHNSRESILKNIISIEDEKKRVYAIKLILEEVAHIALQNKNVLEDKLTDLINKKDILGIAKLLNHNSGDSILETIISIEDEKERVHITTYILEEVAHIAPQEENLLEDRLKDLINRKDILGIVEHLARVQKNWQEKCSTEIIKDLPTSGLQNGTKLDPETLEIRELDRPNFWQAQEIFSHFADTLRHTKDQEIQEDIDLILSNLKLSILSKKPASDLSNEELLAVIDHSNDSANRLQFGGISSANPSNVSEAIKAQQEIAAQAESSQILQESECFKHPTQAEQSSSAEMQEYCLDSKLATQFASANPPISHNRVRHDGTVGLFNAKVRHRKVEHRKPSPHAQPSTTLTIANASKPEYHHHPTQAEQSSSAEMQEYCLDSKLATQFASANPPISHNRVRHDGTVGLFNAKVRHRKVEHRKPSPHAQPSTTLTIANASKPEYHHHPTQAKQSSSAKTKEYCLDSKLATQFASANPPISHNRVRHDGTVGLFNAKVRHRKVEHRKPSPHAQPSTTLTTANANQSESASIER